MLEMLGIGVSTVLHFIMYNIVIINIIKMEKVMYLLLKMDIKF